jgi:hypothetical protein
MNVNQALAGEFVIAVGINSWGALKQKNLPWPGTLARNGAAFACLGLVAVAAPELAVLLGGAFLLASVVNLASHQSATGKWSEAFGANPPDQTSYYTLKF